MCGRYTLSAPIAVIEGLFPGLVADEPLAPRYNIAPTQSAPVVANDGSNRLQMFQWGLVPFWADDPRIGNRMINARAETLGEKPAFRAAYQSRRCLVPADGFYEWRKTAGAKTKTPYHLSLKSGAPFAIAGLWELWKGPDEKELKSFTIITTEANELVRPLHDRMPVIMRGEDYGRWLSPERREAADLAPLLAPFPAERMQARAVSTLVNNPAHDSPDCIRPVAEAGEERART